jgi:hypothetical protein
LFIDIVYKVYFISIKGIKSIVGALLEMTERKEQTSSLILPPIKIFKVIFRVMTQ